MLLSKHPTIDSYISARRSSLIAKVPEDLCGQSATKQAAFKSLMSSLYLPQFYPKSTSTPFVNMFDLGLLHTKISMGKNAVQFVNGLAKNFFLHAPSASLFQVGILLTVNANLL